MRDLVFQDFLAQIQIRTRKLRRQSPFQTSDQTLLHALQIHGRLIRREDQLLAQLMQVIEDMEEGILRPVHADHLLDIIQDQHIDILIEMQEIVGRILSHRIRKLHTEQVRRDIKDTLLRMQLTDARTNRIAEVRLSHPGRTIDKQRVESGLSRILRHGLTCRSNQLIACPLEIVLKVVTRIQMRVNILRDDRRERAGRFGALFRHGRLHRRRDNLGWIIHGAHASGTVIHHDAIFQLDTLPEHSAECHLQHIHIMRFQELIEERAGHLHRKLFLRSPFPLPLLISERDYWPKPCLVLGLRHNIPDNAQALIPQYFEISLHRY